MEKQTLKQYRSILREIAQLEEEKHRTLERLQGAAAGTHRVHAGLCTAPDRIGTMLARCEHYQRVIDARLDALIDLREEIEQAIADLPSAERQLLRLRYIEGKTWEQVADALNYDLRWVTRLHCRTLQKIAGPRKKP